MGLGATAVAGGVWGALLARVMFELWPLWFANAIPLSAVLAGCGALAAPLLLWLFDHRPGASLLARAWPLACGTVYVVQPAVVPVWGVAALLAGLGGALWLARQPDAGGSWVAERLWDVLAFVAPLGLYVATLAPSVLPGDSGEFQFVAPMLGIPHPTGYPLYLVLGKLFSLLPIGSVAYRLNLLSAFAAAGAVWAVYRAGRALGLHYASAAVGAGLLAVSETFWSQATIAEKYALNAFFCATTLWLGLRWRAERLAGQRGRRWLVAWSLCYGLSLTHHRTMALLAPVYAWLLWRTDRDRPDRRASWHPVLLAAALAVVPLVLYLLLPILSARNPPYAYVRIDSLKAFLDLVLARTYQSGLFRGGLDALPGRLSELGMLLVRQFGPLGLVLSIAGWATLVWRERRVAWVLLAGIGVQIAFALNYYVPNTPVYYLPAYVWLAICAAVAVDAATVALPEAIVRRTGAVKGLIQAASRQSLREGGRPAQPHLALALILLAAALPVALLAARWQGMDQRRAYASLSFDHTYGQAALGAVAQNALVVSDWQPATVLWYMHWVEGLAPAAQIASLDSLEWQWRGLVEAALAAGRPVYLSRPVANVAERYPVRSAGPLAQVLPEPETALPSTDRPLDVALGGEIRLLGVDWMGVAPGPEGASYVPVDGQVAGGSTLYVTLHWQAARAPAGDYAVTVRLLDANGGIRLEKQNRHPVGGTYPTSRWRPGEVVADTYRLDLPPWLPSGEYELRATVGTPFAGRGLEDVDGTDHVLLGTIAVRKPLRWPREASSVPMRARCTDRLVLMGYDGPREVAPGETVSLALRWLVLADGSDDLPWLNLVSKDGTRSALRSPLNVPEDWRAGALVVQPYAVPVPEGFAYLETQLGECSRRLPVRATAAPPPVANFGGQIRLRSYEYASRTLRPGDTVRLTLEWEAVMPVDEPYKVFVHVLGPQGLPIAQQDNEPVNGTYPTTRWQRGERISDPYVFALPESLPPGEYPVEVGLYLPADFSRLPVLDRAQNVIDDKVFLEPLIVQ